MLKQFTSESTINYIAYNDPEYDRIVAAAVEENDLAKKAELYNEAQKNIMDSGCLYDDYILYSSGCQPESKGP